MPPSDTLLREMGEACVRVATFWDSVIKEFLDGSFPLPPPLDRWFRAYEGQGRGLVDREALPEPYLGPILGSPRGAMLGLNPGRPYPAFQYRDGILASEIRAAGSYSSFARTHFANREPWLSAVGPVGYLKRRVRWMQLWNDDDSLNDGDLLIFELYPWHSIGLTSPIRPNDDIVREFILTPIAEVGVRHVFAFGKPWFDVFEQLGLRRLLLLGERGEPYPSAVRTRAVGVYEGMGETLLVAEKHAGSAGPPSQGEMLILRDELARRNLL